MKKCLAILLGVIGICLYYAHRFITKAFGYLPFEIILSNINSVGDGDPEINAKGFRYAWWAIFFSILWSLIIVFSKPISKVLSLLYTNPKLFYEKIKELFLKGFQFLGKFYYLFYKHITTSLLLFSLFLFGNALYKTDKSFGFFEFIYNRFLVPDCNFFEQNSYFPQSQDLFFDNGKKNLVVILGESFEVTFNEPDIEGAPLLRECAREAISGESMPNLYSPSDCGWTIGAYTAWHFGLPLKSFTYTTGGQYISTQGFLPHATSIFDLLKEHGYEMGILSGSDFAYAGRDLLFRHGGFSIFDLNYWMKKGWDLKKEGANDWGFNDEFILKRGREIYDDFLKMNKPFVLFLEMCDTHYPTGFCPEQEREFGDIRDAYKHLDKLLASFIKDMKFKDNTVVALIGDHLLMGLNVWIPKEKRSNRKEHRLFNAFWGDIPPFSLERKRTVLPYDIAPTLLEATGARWKTRRYGLGVSFFASEPSLADSMGVDEIYKKIIQPSKFYNSLY